MTISDLKIYEYRIPLKMPLKILGENIRERRGLILKLVSSGNHVGFGEIAPLGRFSEETFDEAKTQIFKIKGGLFEDDIPANVEKLTGAFETWFEEFNLFPSVRCGIEMSILNLISNIKQFPLHKLISSDFHEKIRINGLLYGSKDEVKKQAQELLAQGYNSLKLKVGENLREDIAKTQAVSEIVNGRALLHVDANRSWSLNEGVEFGNEVGLAAVDYIEEPFKKVTDIPDFFMKTTIPVALDESLRDLAFEELKSIEGVDIIILKPTILGGFEKVMEYSRNANRFAIETIISSTFESGIGLEAISHLAGATVRDRTAGLDTLKWFQHDLLVEPLKFDHGKMNIHRLPLTDKDINFKLLTELSS